MRRQHHADIQREIDCMMFLECSIDLMLSPREQASNCGSASELEALLAVHAKPYREEQGRVPVPQERFSLPSADTSFDQSNIVRAAPCLGNLHSQMADRWIIQGRCIGIRLLGTLGLAPHLLPRVELLPTGPRAATQCAPLYVNCGCIPP